MSKTSSTIPSPRAPAAGQVPSFEVVRQDEEVPQELRRNQTVPMKFGLRRELAVHELPKLPAEHLRVTEDDMDAALTGLHDESGEREETKPGRVSRHKRDGRLIVGLLFLLGAAALALLATRKPQPAIEAPAASQQPTNAAPTVANASPIFNVAPPTPSVPERRTVTPKASPKVTSVAPKAVKPAIGKATATKDPSSEYDPNELMFKPQ